MAKFAALATAAVAALVLVACSGDDGNDAPTAAQQTAPTSRGATTVPRLTAPVATGGAATTTSSIASARKANANVATLAELTAALQANGVDNAAFWAADIIENRPYATNDPNFTKVRGNLAEDNLTPAVVEKIIASLSL